ncbi:glycosyltransferase family 2 protein [Nanoarchaeota archaeon]
MKKVTNEAIVLIPNFNGEKLLIECLSSVLEQKFSKFGVILVDDGSKDGSVESTRKKFPSVDILALDKNQGFAKAVNKGLRYAFNKYSPKYVALLNNDTIVDKFWLGSLIGSMSSNENIAAVTSNMLSYDDPNVIDGQGVTYNFVGEGKGINVFKRREDVKSPEKKVLGACFGAALLRTVHLKRIGLLDERFFSYNEDVDWSLGANLLGYDIIFDEKAIVYHKGSSSWKNRSMEKKYLCMRNSFCLMIKNYKLKSLIKLSPMLFNHYFRSSLGYFLNRKIQNGRLVKLSEKKVSFEQRIKHSILPLRAAFWNIANIWKTLYLRKKIQSKRSLSDRELFKLFDKSYKKYRK